MSQLPLLVSIVDCVVAVKYELIFVIVTFLESTVSCVTAVVCRISLCTLGDGDPQAE